MKSQDLHLHTGTRPVSDITEDVSDFVRGEGDGMCLVFAPHATAGIALMETGSGSEDDLAEALQRILPRDIDYQHSHGAKGHGADHLIPALVSPSLTVPVTHGKLELGTWQRIVLVDLNVDNPKRN